MPQGPEGPIIHLGGIIGGGIAQSRSKTLGISLQLIKGFAFKQWNNDRDRRDFIALGTACGVAAAFGAPIGGVLFAMEETASFWSTTQTWRTRNHLFCPPAEFVLFYIPH
jgi:chloride channel 7